MQVAASSHCLSFSGALGDDNSVSFTELLSRVLSGSRVVAQWHGCHGDSGS
jgi:hypothetical protein